ncbi:flagellar biosynthesis anti-sigma factor FlgM [Paraburkholderia phytofirmans]|uniref:Negative regulator of flagellin synthesis n=1 Tax=Paraburkholderia phytofirmans OLGA172 TaxID=1417228 RepID=A0A160FNK7_9BURK|nr:flagellar biosynthesis anti-sigma factor FlgM [Paraburkholderia phytofirmans]ANB74329.1 flagellar biosynthesis anti-sigma factor FlgM [Paraburkholderia phytofirmans OLGA172]
MKVDSTTKSNLSSLKDALSRSQQSDAASANSNAQSAGTASQPTTSGSGDASVSLSGLSQHLRSLAASGSADIDTASVESIKAAIKDGSLTIDSSKIADGVLNTARELLQSKTSSTGN